MISGRPFFCSAILWEKVFYRSFLWSAGGCSFIYMRYNFFDFYTLFIPLAICVSRLSCLAQLSFWPGGPYLRTYGNLYQKLNATVGKTNWNLKKSTCLVHPFGPLCYHSKSIEKFKKLTVCTGLVSRYVSKRNKWPYMRARSRPHKLKLKKKPPLKKGVSKRQTPKKNW